MACVKPNRIGVNERDVTEVEEIVGHKEIGSHLRGSSTRSRHSTRDFPPGRLRNIVRIRFGGPAHPHPNNAEALDDRERTDVRGRGNFRLSRNTRAAPIAVYRKTVVGQLISSPSTYERKRAPRCEQTSSTALAAPTPPGKTRGNRENGTGQRPVPNFSRSRGQVPVILQERHRQISVRASRRRRDSRARGYSWQRPSGLSVRSPCPPRAAGTD